MACQPPSRSCWSQASRCPAMPPVSSTSGGDQGEARPPMVLSMRTGIRDVGPTGVRELKTDYQTDGRSPEG